MPLRPGTPIKAVLGNFYGEISGFQHKVRKQEFNQMDEVDRERLMNPPRTHTRASAMAGSYVTNTQKASTIGLVQPTSIFKMRKFLAVKPRTDTINHSYKPLKRGTSELGRTRNKKLL